MNLVERAKAISLNPAATWPVIDAEKHDAQSLFVPYMLILAAIPAVAQFIGMSVIGMGGFGFHIRMPILSGLGMMVSTYVLTLVMTFALGWLVSVLAPSFGGQSNLEQGLKIAVFGCTPMMLAGVLYVLPMLTMIGILVAFYSLYVMYLGLPVLMKNPKEKTIPYMVVLIIAGLVGGAVLGMVSALFTPSMANMMGNSNLGGQETSIATPIGDIKVNQKAGSGDGSAQATFSTPAGKAVITTTPGTSGKPNDPAVVTIQTADGEVKLDMKNMEAMAKQMEAMAKQMEQNKK